MNINLTHVTYQNQPLSQNNAAINAQTQGNMAAGADGSKTIQVPAGLSATDAGKALLASLKVGDSFTGEITNITQNQITISLSDSVQISAILSNALSYNIGDMASFTIKDNSGQQILLQSNPNANLDNLMNDQTINQALQNAHLTVNETTVSLVHEMMKQNVPITPQNLTQYAKGLEAAPSATPEDVVFLNKMNIPVSEENIQALHDYYNYSEEIPNQTAKFSEDISQALLNMADADPAEAATFMKNFQEAFSEPISIPETIAQNMTLQERENLSDSIHAILREDTQTESDVNQLTEKLKEGNMTAKETFHAISEILSKQQEPSEAIHRLLSSKEYTKLTESMLRQEMFLNPEDVTKDNVKKLFAKILIDHHSMEEKFAAQPKAQNLLQDMAQVKNQVDFQNQLNHFMNFVQIPLKMNGQNAHGDLYVYKNNRQKSVDDDELKAALHLDMDHLKTLDILVKLKGKNVTTDFKVETDEILTFIEMHLDELNARLRALGYNVSSNVESIHDKSDYSFKKNVLEEELPPMEIKRFSFDVRA